ncbi:MAG: hypothetical protein WAW96_10925, partial [Alphaproteobacteria bacterium]
DEQPRYQAPQEDGAPSFEASDEEREEARAEFGGEPRPNETAEEGERRRRRRGRRGGRRNRRRDREGNEQRLGDGRESDSTSAQHAEQSDFVPRADYQLTDESPAPEPITYEAPVLPEPPRRERIEIQEVSAAEARAEHRPAAHAAPEASNGHDEERIGTERARAAPVPEPEPEIEDPNRPRRKGWWQKKIFG